MGSNLIEIKDLIKGEKNKRVQTGVRMNKNLIKVLKALAEYYEISLGEMIETILLESFKGHSPFDPKTLKLINDLKRIYDLDIEDKHHQSSEDFKFSTQK